MNFNYYFEYKNGELYWKVSKQKIKIGQKAGTLNNSGYRVIKFNQKSYLEHRIIFALHKGYMPEFVDHIDGNTINNHIENLREATKTQNHYNRNLQKNNTSGIKGVCWHKPSKKWSVNLIVNGEKKYFGTYFDKEVARFVVEAMRCKYHGNFANHG